VRRAVVAGVALLAALSAAAILLALGSGGVPQSPAANATTAPSQAGTSPFVESALLYDSLSVEYPNDSLVEAIVSALEEAGVEVTVVKGYNASLDWLVAASRFDLVIIRAHGAYNGDPGSGRPLGTYIYTGLPEALAYTVYGDYLVEGLERGYFAFGVIPRPGVPLEELTRYLTVSPLFIREQLPPMQGAIVVFSGCYGLADERLAQAFISLGARAFIGWDGNVTLQHSDAALAALVEELAASGWDPHAAAEAVASSLGPDPYTGAVLRVAARG